MGSIVLAHPRQTLSSPRLGGASTSMPIVAPECLLEYRPAGPVGVFTSSHPSQDVGREGEPNQVENAMLEDDSNEEPADIGRDNNDEIPTNPAPSTGQPTELAPTFEDQGLHEGNSVAEFQVGQSFHSKEEAVLTIKDYIIRCGVEYRVMESDHLKYHGRCKEFGKGSVSIKVLQEATEGTYGFKPTYRKTWLAKQKAIVQIYGDWEESYAELPRWILGVQSTMEGTVALLKTSPVRVGDDVDDSTVIDGTHLYGKYGGTLLLAIAQYGNSNILPITFSLVVGKNAKSWSFFLTNLRQHVTPQQGILVISDRHNGIKTALENPNSGCFKGMDAKRLLVKAAYAKTEAEFHYWFDIMRAENPAMCDWTNRIEYDKWTQHQDGG
ncbi:uncharacterized protein LOC107487710 [Arachis duranensis]|uniref:Uncharacterized protein LOC107487710 n=1 Tax=Arachis duranensis TaxID=130453 RepID=A0A6P4D892_ARADU|nr:uncharacterized protein LOC107487710 [Arachis duranensis]